MCLAQAGITSYDARMDTRQVIYKGTQPNQQYVQQIPIMTALLLCDECISAKVHPQQQQSTTVTQASTVCYNTQTHMQY